MGINKAKGTFTVSYSILQKSWTFYVCFFIEFHMPKKAITMEIIVNFKQCASYNKL